MPFLSRDKSLYKTFFPLLIVISLQQLAACAVNMTDNIMLGAYSELSLNGATLVNQLQYILQQIAAGIGTGIAVLCSQYWGKRDITPIRQIASIGLKLAFLVGLLFFAATSLFPTEILGLLTNNAEVVAEGAAYLDIMRWTYLVFAISNALMYTLQSVETAFIGTLMSVSTICINVCLNFCLIYGNLGAPELGIRGAAIATLISRCVELIIIMVYVCFLDKKLRMKLRDMLALDFYYIKDFMSVSLPVVISCSLWGISQAVQTSILGHISKEAIAANSVAVAIYSVITVFGFSCANAASVTIGKAIGAGKLGQIHSYSRTLQFIFLCMGIITGTALFLCKELLLGFYAISEETRVMCIEFMIVLAITVVGSCYEYPVAYGIMAGGGDTKFPVLIDNIATWLFMLPLSFLSAFVFEFPPVVTFLFLKLDQVAKCIPNGIRCNRYKWVRQLTRDNTE